jgi:hypothetical protein
MRLPLAFLAAVFAVLLIGCGGSGLPHSNQVTVSVTPAQTTIAAGASVSLTGQGTGFTADPVIQWWIKESRDLDVSNDCGLLSSQAPPQSGCPYGYVMYDPVEKIPSSATYYAPTTPGTYHVTFTATQVVEFNSLTNSAEGTITVQ